MWPNSLSGPDGGRLHQADPSRQRPKLAQNRVNLLPRVRARCLALVDLFLGPPKGLLIDTWVGVSLNFGFQERLGPRHRPQNLREGLVRLAVDRVVVGPSRGDPLEGVSARRMQRVLPDASVDAPSG